MPTIDASTVTFTQSGTGAVQRTLEEKLFETASARDFGAVGDAGFSGVTVTGTDDTAALQAWLDVGLAGRPLYLPSGRYKVSSTLSGQIANVHRRLTIQGDGAANTEIIFAGDVDDSVIDLTGNMPDNDLLVMRGFRVTMPDLGAEGLGTGAGIRVRNVRNFILDDLRTLRTGIGINLIGCLVGQVSNYLSYYDRKGMTLEQGIYLSTPNAITLDNCSFLASYYVGLELAAPTLVRMTGGTVEGAGAENPSPAAGITVNAAGAAGAVGIAAHGVYFEGNHGPDVYITHGEGAATYAFRDCTFNRLNEQVQDYHIVLDCAALSSGDKPALLDVRGSAFPSYHGYTPSSTRPAVAFNVAGGFDGITFLDEGALYTDAIERPVAPADALHPLMISACGFILGNGSLLRNRGIESVTWVATGYCEIVLGRGTSEFVITGLTSDVGNDLRGYDLNATTILVECKTKAGVLTNGNFFFAGVHSRG